MILAQGAQTSEKDATAVNPNEQIDQPMHAEKVSTSGKKAEVWSASAAADPSNAAGNAAKAVKYAAQPNIKGK